MVEVSTRAPLRGYFGTDITPCTFEQWLAAIQDSLDSGARNRLFSNHNLNSLYLLRRDARFANFYGRSHNCYIDGVPVRLILAGAGVATRAEHRFTLMDHMPELLQHAENAGWRLYFLGSTESVCAQARKLLAQRYPALDLRIHDGYFSDDNAVLEEINTYRPDLLLVGMGMPLQEHWIDRNIVELDAGCISNVGASLDFLIGAQAQPPRWMSRAGLGWLYRLLSDPARLWRRYLVEPWALLGPTMRLWWDCRRQNVPPAGSH